MRYEAPSHTEAVFDPRKFPHVVDWVASVVSQQKYEALAACGHSGLIVAGAVCYKLEIPLIAVRKGTDSAKGDPVRKVNAVLPMEYGVRRRYAFVDDLVASGMTLDHVVREINKKFDEDVMLGGVILYREGGQEVEDRLKHLGWTVPVHTRPYDCP